MAQQNGSIENHASRNLFNESNDEPVACENRMNALLARSLEEAKEKWNFDFKNGVPLDGDWVWERVEDDGRESHLASAEATKENRNPNS